MTMASLVEILNSKIGKDGKSKAYIANELGVGEKTIENYMRGLRNPKPDALIKLSRLLKFELSSLSEQNVPREKNAPTGAQDAQNGDEKPPATETKTKNKLTTVTVKPSYEVQPGNGKPNDKDTIIKSQAEAIKSQADLLTEAFKENKFLIRKLLEKR